MKLKDSPNPILRQKAAFYANELRKSYPAFLPGRLFGPNATIRKWIGDLERRIHRTLGAATVTERLLSFVAVGAAMWTWLTLKFDFLQHPRLQRNAYRLPGNSWNPSELLDRLQPESSLPNVSLKTGS